MVNMSAAPVSSPCVLCEDYPQGNPDQVAFYDHPTEAERFLLREVLLALEAAEKGTLYPSQNRALQGRVRAAIDRTRWRAVEWHNDAGDILGEDDHGRFHLWRRGAGGPQRFETFRQADQAACGPVPMRAACGSLRGGAVRAQSRSFTNLGQRA